MHDYFDINNEELLKDFFSEAEQQVENLESNILVIENDPTNHEAIDEIFRAAHTLKGGSATVEMHELSGFTHIVEDILDELRSKTLKVTEDVVDVLLSSIDIIKTMLEKRANGSIYEEDVEPIKARLRSLIPHNEKEPILPHIKNVTNPPTQSNLNLLSPIEQLSEHNLLELKQICPSGQSLWGVTVLFDKENPMNSVGGIQIFSALKDTGNILLTIPDFDELYEDKFHEQVVYYISTTFTGDELENTAFLDDVVLAVDAQNLDTAQAPSTVLLPNNLELHTAVLPIKDILKDIPTSLPSPLIHLSDDELYDLKEMATSGQKAWGVTVFFDESNPMKTVGAIQVYAILKKHGSILKSIPDFDELYEDKFYQQVVYYIITTLSGEDLEDIALLDDVVLAVDALSLDTAVLKHDMPSESVPENSKVAQIDQEITSQATVRTTDSPLITEKTLSQKKPVTATSQQGSILRVESKRIDNLLNLVSETVIAKAAFNQTMTTANDLHTKTQLLCSDYKEQLRRLFEHLPSYVERMKNGENAKEIRTGINEEFGGLYSLFDQFESDFKSFTSKFRTYTQNLGRISGELQEGVMKIRMVPISQIFSRFPRVLRDLSRDLNKKINLVIEGEETELDKSVVEDLLDPIMHCVRNSIDHGIEQPANRLASNKAEEGTITLRASNEGNMIVIEIEDDGTGINVETIRTKAIEKGLIHPTKIITDQEAFNFIFDAGFSTASKITNVSGRGVGLDVVKTQIEKLNGTVLVSSEKDVGTKFTIRLPLTLAIIQGLLVRVGNEVYSIPIASVIESQRIKTRELNRIDNYEVLNVRNEVISVLRLARLFGIKDSKESEFSFIVIVGTADKKIGIMVDSLIGEEDVVIKPLTDQFVNSPGIAGASILGDGSVSLIIDVSQLLALGIKLELSAREERIF